VAIETPPDCTYSTNRYVLLTGVPLANWSVTVVMMLLEPSQKNVATTASPWCGFVGNAATNEFPLSPSEPPGAVPPLAATSNRGAPGPPRAGPTESLHAAARSAAPRILGRLARRPRTGLTLIAGVDPLQ